MKITFNGRDCELKVETYLTTDRPALTLYDARNGGYVAQATANFGDVPLKPNQVIIKDHEENQGMLRALEKAGVVRPTGVLESGREEFPICELLVTERHETRLDPLVRKAVEEVKTVMAEGKMNGVPYAALDDHDKRVLLGHGIDWNPYIEQGLGTPLVYRIVNNAVAGQAPEHWPEPDAFERVATNLARQWRDDGLTAESWQELSAQRQVGYLAGFAAVHDVSFERFLQQTAEQVLGVTDFSADGERQIRQQFDNARDWAGRNGEERRRQAIRGDSEKQGIGTMRVIVAGSRGITDYQLVCEAIRQSGFPVGRIVSGMAQGVDTLAVRYAQAHGIPCDRIPADWNRWGRSAGYRRNEHMAQHADALIAVWDGKSPGTKHMIDVARQRNLKVFIAGPELVKEQTQGRNSALGYPPAEPSPASGPDQALQARLDALRDHLQGKNRDPEHDQKRGR